MTRTILSAIRGCAGGCLLLIAAAGAFPGTARADIHVSLTTTGTTVAAGSDFEVDVVVTQAGTAFNAYATTISFDPGAISFAPTAPTTLQEGPYMIGACGNTFVDYHAAADSITVSHSLLCGGMQLTGPGEVYRLHFHAGLTPQSTTIQFRRGVRFFNAGVQAGPVVSANLTITIGTAAAVGTPGAALPLAVRAELNPFHGHTWVRYQGADGTARGLTVRDVSGRLLRDLSPAAGSSAGLVAFDGRDDHGSVLPSGTYWLVLRSRGRQAVSRATLVR